jgi:anti-anti-sigma regulatory factor
VVDDGPPWVSCIRVEAAARRPAFGRCPGAAPGMIPRGCLMRATIRTSVTSREPEIPFLLSIDIRAGRVAVHGDFDREHVERFLDSVSLLEYSASPCWSVDVAGVSFCDAGGLRALLEARRFAERTGRTFRITGAGPWMRHLLPMIGLTGVESSRILRSVS